MDNKEKYRDGVRMILREHNQKIISTISCNLEKYFDEKMEKYSDMIHKKNKENDREGMIFFTACYETAKIIKKDLKVYFNETKNILCEVANEPG